VSVKDQSGATMSGASVSWATNAASVATVSSSGTVTAVDNGSAIITATSGAADATAAVTVTQVAATLELSQDSLTFGVIGDTLTLTATATDAGGNSIVEFTVDWSSSDTGVATVSSAGLVTAVTNGADTITATSGSASTTAAITVNQSALTLDAITVNWTEGAAATITGTGFGATTASNTVMVDGLTASITSASITELQITVPTSACKPSRMASMVVTVASESATTTVGVQPASVWSLELGSGVTTAGGGECIHLDAGSGSEQYIVGVYSSSESETSLTPYNQTAITGTVLASEVALYIPVVNEDVGYFEAPIIVEGDRQADTPPYSQQRVIDPEREADRIAHAEAELRLREAEDRLVGELGSGPQIFTDIIAERAEATPGTPGVAHNLGDTIAIRVPINCSAYDSISAVVRYVGTSGLYLEDLGNPVGMSFTAAEYATWDATFSATTLPKIVKYFGDLSDNTGFGLDDADRIGVLITKEVNKKDGLLGFMHAIDFYPTSTCPSSNYADLFYGLAPDPDGVHGNAKTKEYVADLMPALIAHETTHIVQKTQDIHRDAGSKARWETEGGATMAEWLVGNSIWGHGGANQNMGLTEYNEGLDWYHDLGVDAAYYFGYSSSGKVAGAPEQCTWLAKSPPGVCGAGNRAVYGVPATLLRFILDWYGPGYSGGEAALMRDLTSSAQTGYDNLVKTTGAKSFAHIQTLFGLNLYSDGRTGVAQGTYTSALTYFDYTAIGLKYVEDAQLQPYTSSAAEPTISKSVRGGSTAYLEWEPPSSHAPTSIRIRTPSGDKLPDVIGMWIFRIQ